MAKSFQNGDVVLRKAEITSAIARASILPQLQGLDIWEDMGKPTVYATFYMFDAIGMLTRFPIIGEEAIELTFETPGMAAAATYRFRVFEIVNVQQSDTRQGVAYTLRCCSEESLTNADVEVAQSYEGTLDSLVVQTLKRNLKSSKPIALEETRGIHQLVLPKMTPLQVIDYCRKNAVSKRNSSSSYAFFETQSGFTFRTVEGIAAMSRSNVGSRVFTFLDAPDTVESSVNYRAVLEYENMKRSDTVGAIIGGQQYSATETFDLFTKKRATVEYKLQDAIGKLQGPDGRLQNVNTSAFTRAVKDPTRFHMAIDSSRPAQYVEDALGPRNSMAHLINGNITRLLVHGDSALRAGDVVTLQLQDVKGFTGPQQRDPLMSGNYILLRLRHIISCGPKNQHRIAVDAAKIGFAA